MNSRVFTKTKKNVTKGANSVLIKINTSDKSEI